MSENKEYDLSYNLEGYIDSGRLDHIYREMIELVLVDKPIFKAPGQLEVFMKGNNPQYSWSVHKTKKYPTSLVLVESLWSWGALEKRVITINDSNPDLEKEIEEIIERQDNLARERRG